MVFIKPMIATCEYVRWGGSTLSFHVGHHEKYCIQHINRYY
jgi:hypothetical protein